MQRQEGLWIQEVYVMVPQRWVFRVCTSKLASDESLGYQHMGTVYHRGRSQIASTSKSHGGDLIIQRYDWSGWRVRLIQCSHSFKGARKVRGQGRKFNGSGKANHSRSFPLSERSTRVNKDQHNSANPTPDLVIGELKQHGGSEFDYSTTAMESCWEPKGRVVTKVED
ncbi:hypothetical protein B296_00002503 [Ensete ventricosum]|uniref:Uncharacterized protein n=1 Tax=Ensete ventricosum TaxID=4639 RepID=A0A427AUG8_ENSVE|nr:hypothetical protein B296_00002503 [Ensete ventricosum]